MARWRELIDAFLVQRERLVRIHPDLYDMSQPNPGATEEQLLAAEERLGHRIPAQYREFLTVANGWKDWCQSNSLLSCADIGDGLLGAGEFSVFFDGDPREWRGYEDWMQISTDENSYWSAYMLRHVSQGEAAGSVYLWPHGDRILGSFESYLTDELTSMTAWVDGEDLGPHGRAWGRDISSDPPTMREIVERYAVLREEVEALHIDATIASRPNPGATTAELDDLEERLGRSLHPEHREFLLVANGWPGIPYTLSTAEIADGARWRESLEARDRADAEDRTQERSWFAHLGLPVPEASSKPSAVEVARVGGVIPFAAWAGCSFGVDPDDGFVRWVPLDGKYGEGPGTVETRSAGTVRDHLLAEIDQLSLRIQAARGGT